MSQKIQLEITPIHRQIFLSFVIMQYLLFFSSIFLLAHYHALGLSFLPYPSMVTTTSTQTHYLWNTSLVIAFWFQHIVMATIKYKVSWVKYWKYFALYDRYIYNTMSGMVLIVVICCMKPSYHYLFTIPTWICAPLVVVGIYFFVTANKVVGKQVMMPFSIGKIFGNKSISIAPYEEKKHTTLITTGAYGLVRHPMQAGALFLTLFGNGTYTIERLIFCAVMTLFITIGVIMQERRLCFLEQNYKEYMKKVRARFIPYVI